MNATCTTSYIPKATTPKWTSILKTLVVGLLSPQNLMDDNDALAVCQFDAQ